MSWDSDNYPPTMKNLSDRVRNRAIEIANLLMEHGYEVSSAVAVAVSHAKAWDAQESQDTRSLNVFPHPEGWAVHQDGTREVIVLPTKEDARNRAIELGEDEGRPVVIHDDNGRVNEYVDLIRQEGDGGPHLS